MSQTSTPLTPLPAMLLAALVCAADLITKAAVTARLAYGGQIEVAPSLNIVHAINKGAAFGLLATAGGWQRYLFIVIAVAASLGLVYMICKPASRSLERIGLAMILGGALGNLADRVARAGVTDWIDVFIGTHHWPAFNIADIGIVVGTALFIWAELRTAQPDRATAAQVR